MSDQSPLIVPLVVEALVVNDHVRLGGDAFLRMQMGYSSMQQCASGQPGLSDNDTNFVSAGVIPNTQITCSDYYNGVYLKWRLPRAFRHGKQDNASGTTTFPPVPNRWLVVRQSGPLASRRAAAWIIESDYQVPQHFPAPQNASQVGALYVGGGSKPVGMYIGRNVPLGTWAGPNTTLHLTAMAPGNPAFAFYQPQSNNVFSFIDALNGQPAETLSYLVLGWLSNPADDLLAKVTPPDTFASLLQSLDWTLPKGTDPTLTATWSLLCGSVTGVQWQTDTKPEGGAPTGTPVSIAVGNTSADALTALINAQAADTGESVETDLLEAFQLDLVDVLDKPDGAALLAESVHSSFFAKLSGGYSWQIVDAPGVTAQLSDEELANERKWLATLNQAQAGVDQARRELVALQIELYAMWWKYTAWPSAIQRRTNLQGLGDQTALQAQLDPNSGPSTGLPNGSIAWQVAQKKARVASLAASVPDGNTPELMQAAISTYAPASHLPPNRVLKRQAAPRFHLPNNPVVLIAGAGASGIMDDPSPLLCRFPSQIVAGFNYNGSDVSAATAGLSIPQPDLSGVSGVPWSAALAANLIQEFFFLDPNNAAMISAVLASSNAEAIAQAMSDAANETGAVSTGALQQWRQNPWHPLLLLWQANYYPIDYGTPSVPNWTFDRGEYRWHGALPSVGPAMAPGGVIQLTPAAAFNMESRIKAFLANSPSLDPDELKAFETLLEFVQASDKWDLLSQALNGFNDHLLLRQSGVFLGPKTTSLVTDPPLPALIGDVDGAPPAVGNIPRNALATTSFQSWRAGQFVFLNLLVVDEWGQALWPIDSTNYQNETLFLPPGLTPVLASNAVTFTIASGAAIGSLTPNLAIAGGADLALTVNGVGFASGAAVQWNGTALNTTFVSATQLTAVVPAKLISADGSAQVSLVQAGATSNSLPFTIVAKVAIGSLTPSLALAGTAGSAVFELTVDGVGFAAGSVVQWNGVPVDTSFISDTQLSANVPAVNIGIAGQADVTVVPDGTSAPASFTISAGPAIASLAPGLIEAGGGEFTIAVNGVGFSAQSEVLWNGARLATAFVSPEQLTAEVPANLIASPGTASVAEVLGHSVLPQSSDSLVQLPPGLLQPARLRFDLVSATDDNATVDLVPGADPICGWILPNHLDGSLMAYDAQGNALAEMAVGITAANKPDVCWTPMPGSPYSTPGDIAKAIRHFGPFLLALSQQDPATFAAFLRAIDETLWTTLPMGAAFDKSLAVLMGRPLALVRAQLQFELDGPPYLDPSWQYTFAPRAPDITGYQFAIELGNIDQIEDGLIGYFLEDEYGAFNVVQQAGAAEGSYLRSIGLEDNYLYRPFDGQTVTHVSMLVDPRASVHATTAILPVVEAALPPPLVDAALAAMEVVFRVNGILTDQKIAALSDGQPGETTVLMPVPKEKAGVWTWLENDKGTWTSFATGPNDATARLPNVPPVLRRGLLKLSQAFGKRPN